MYLKHTVISLLPLHLVLFFVCGDGGGFRRRHRWRSCDFYLDGTVWTAPTFMTIAPINVRAELQQKRAILFC